MKKYGYRMELIGGIGFFLLAMASDADAIGMMPLLLLLGCCVALTALGDMFTRPCKSRRVRQAICRTDVRKAPAAAARIPAVVSFPPAA